MIRLARWALTAAAVLMGWSLIATVWSTHRNVVAASDTLIRGQADMFHDALKFRVGPRRAITSADLDEVLAGLSEDGLRYVALLGRGGEALASAGTPRASGGLPPAVGRMRGPAPEPMVVGDRVVVMFRRPERGVVMEFEPITANELRSAANQSLLVGALAAGGFLLVAVGLVRWFLRRESLERALEHERRLASLGEMSAVLAHEIRNPLASLKGNAQLLARGLPEGEPPRAKAERVVDEAVRLEALTNDLLEFARMGAIERAPVDPADLLAAAAQAVDPSRIAVDTAGAPPRWSLDADRMRQVLVNLLENAVHAGNSVTAAITSQGRELSFSVTDDGPGVAPEDQPHIFEPFFTRRTTGTGLGLAVSKRIVELHGGRISVTNAPGGGARFQVTIPRT